MPKIEMTVSFATLARYRFDCDDDHLTARVKNRQKKYFRPVEIRWLADFLKRGERKTFDLCPLSLQSIPLETSNLFNAGVSAMEQNGKSADPTCYSSPVAQKSDPAVDAAGLFENRRRRMTMTRKQLARFIKTRLGSSFNSNIQFQVDATECGFEVKELGDPKPFTYNGSDGYIWHPVFDDGTTGILVEYGCYLFSPECKGQAAKHFFAHDFPKLDMGRAVKVINPRTGKSPTREEIAARFE